MKSIILLALLVAIVAAKPLDLTLQNFDEAVLNSDKSVFIKFFAPWCGHCKALAPEYEKVADAFAKEKSVAIAEVDCDANKDLCSRFGVKGYPTLKFFPKGHMDAPQDYNGGRQAEDIIKYINENAGTRIVLKKTPSAVVELDDDNFEQIVFNKDKTVFVKFFAPWCGHCKALAPKWIELAAAMKREKDVVIAEYDADAHKKFAEKFEVHGYPTLMMFSKDNKDGQKYEESREPAEMLKYLSAKAGVHRNMDGTLSSDAGVVAALDDEVKEYANGADADQIITKIQAKLLTLPEAEQKSANLYLKIVAKSKDDKNYITNENARVAKLMQSPMSDVKLDELTIRRNILTAFQNAKQSSAEPIAHDEV